MDRYLSSLKKQNFVTLSSTESEMFALTDAVKRAMPLAKLLVELQFNKSVSMNVYQDNMSAIHLAKMGEGIGGKAKHFRVRYHFLKELIQDKVMTILHCRTENMIADLFTKPMIGKERLRQVLRALFNGDREEFDRACQESLTRVINNRK